MKRVAWLVLLAGCWKTDRVELPVSQVQLAPGGEVVDGWVVTDVEVPLRCPDGRDARFLFVHPAEPDGPLPTAILYHSGAFDYVVNPTAAAPLEGETLQEIARLEMPFAVRMAYATLGMFPSPLPTEGHEGAMAAELVERGYALVLPTNCWGDYWHNEPGAADNDFEEDFFFRSGRAAAEWPFRLLSQPLFREAISVELPFEPNTDAPIAVGFGEGGRAIGEVLHIDDDEDGTPDYVFGAVAIDSMVEDLSVVIDSSDQGPGLDRIFPQGLVQVGAPSTAPTLPPTVWIYSPVDTELPEGSQEAMLTRLGQGSQNLILEQSVARHVFSNSDASVAAAVADFLTE